jgi:hypothetical protein
VISVDTTGIVYIVDTCDITICILDNIDIVLIVFDTSGIVIDIFSRELFELSIKIVLLVPHGYFPFFINLLVSSKISKYIPAPDVFVFL